MAKKDMNRCSILLIMREMQTKTTMSYHLTPVRMAIIKKSANCKCWRNTNNFRYADDTTLKAESKEKLKSLLMKVKEESEKLA